PPRMAASLVATEDHRFYSEPGIAPAAAGRVILGRFTKGPDQGGATLYQQLARMLYAGGQSGMLADAEQILLGIKLDLNYSKAHILRMYAAVAYFGHGYYGLAAASCGYFAEQPAGLSWGQAAGQDNALLVLEMLGADRHGGPDRTPPRRRSGGLHGCFTDDPADVIVVGDRVSHPCGGPRPVPNKGR